MWHAQQTARVGIGFAPVPNGSDVRMKCQWEGLMRMVIRSLLIVVVIVVIAFFAFGWWTGSSIQHAVDHRADRPTGTSGAIDASTARARGAELGEKAAVAVSKVAETLDEARITAKIK